MHPSLTELIAVEEVEPGHYESLQMPQAMANNASIAYGGYTIAVGINMAYRTITSKHLLYSVTGTFLGPAVLDRKIKGTCRHLRNTGTFATRLVELSQVLDNGKQRACMVLVVDFHAREPASLLKYSAKPSIPWSPPEGLPTLEETRRNVVRRHGLPIQLVETHEKIFKLKDTYFEQKLPGHGISAQNMNGMLKQIATSQDHLDITDKASADWFRTRVRVHSVAENIAAIAFMMDGGLSFVPLTHSHRFLDDAGAASTLDFAFRVFSDNIQADEWHLREVRTVTGGEGRTYSEARLWDAQGDLVANMTQQSILRPKRPSQKSSL